jgi:hypothetical protein
MNTFRLASALFVSALLLVACGDDKGDTDTTTLTDPTNTTPPATMTDGTTTPDPTTAGPDDTTMDPGTTVDPDTTMDPTNTTPPGPTTTTMTTDPTEDPGGGMYCLETCAADGDCTIMGMDLGFTCGADSYCTSDAGGCASDADCTATFSGWVMDCADQATCMPLGQACVDIGGGVGKCATQPSDFLTCEQIMQAELMLPAIEGGMDLTVCGNTDYTCNADGVCENPCEADTDCANFPGHPTCDTGSGQCTCASDADCSGSGIPGYAVCTDSGTCGCGTNDDCTGMNQDTCYEGTCGCSNSDVCTTPAFDGTTQECKSP